METFIVNIGLPIALIMIAITAALSFIFPLMSSIMNPKGAVKGIVGIVILAAIFLISYSMASPDNPSPYVEVSENIAKLVSAGLTTVGILLLLTVAAMFYSFVSNLFK